MQFLSPLQTKIVQQLHMSGFLHAALALQRTPECPLKILKKNVGSFKLTYIFKCRVSYALCNHCDQNAKRPIAHDILEYPLKHCLFQKGFSKQLGLSSFRLLSPIIPLKWAINTNACSLYLSSPLNFHTGASWTRQLVYCSTQAPFNVTFCKQLYQPSKRIFDAF